MKNKLVKILKSSLNNTFSGKTVKIFLYDTLFYILMLILSFLFVDFIKEGIEKISIFENLNEEMLLMNSGLLDTFLEVMAKFKLYIILAFAIFILVSYLLLSFFKMLIYSNIEKKKINLKNFLRIFCFNLVFLTLSIPLLISIMLAFKPKIMPFIFYPGLFLIINYSALTYFYIIKTDKFLQAIKSSFKTGSKHILLFVLPYLVFLVLSYILSKLFVFIKFTGVLALLIFFLVTILIIQWSRYYIIELVKSYQ